MVRILRQEVRYQPGCILLSSIPCCSRGYWYVVYLVILHSHLRLREIVCEACAFLYIPLPFVSAEALVFFSLIPCLPVSHTSASYTPRYRLSLGRSGDHSPRRAKESLRSIARTIASDDWTNREV
ncbi:hypothetical protein SCHPADRAFT_669956 [Schizopora paradoxa]|uniref:Uncharacterized protein n=1 Tax=Schizopora paradoxa TaxID=27342 RepID=A0A0H2RC12_9AGAM|nr:hypothetical protein SCHPADRAFT_669956 [Schizopora paradoxa]